MLQLDDTSPFAVEMFGFPDAEGVDTLYVVVKGTFELGAAGVEIAEQQQPVTLGDEYRGEPGSSSLRRASEAHLDKTGTDVVVDGQACAPGDRPVHHVDVSVVVAGRQQSARVHGDRYWTEGLGGMRPSRAEPFARVPVVYERTFGGTHVVDAERERNPSVPNNPVGVGFAGKHSAKELLGQPVPNVEDLRAPVVTPSSRGVVAGFGPVAPSWEPRKAYAGTYDEAWQQTRAPYLPRDFDPRFFNVAPPALVVAQGLEGGETVGLVGFHPRGAQRFAIPRCELGIVVQVAGQPRPLPYRLETLAIEPTEDRFCLSWRASLPVDKAMLQVEKVSVSLTRAEGIDAGRTSA